MVLVDSGVMNHHVVVYHGAGEEGTSWMKSQNSPRWSVLCLSVRSIAHPLRFNGYAMARLMWIPWEQKGGPLIFLALSLLAGNSGPCVKIHSGRDGALVSQK